MLTLEDTQTQLSQLADEINREVAASHESGVAAVRHALAAGEALLGARALVAHGAWGDWLAENVYEMSSMRAYKLMALARQREAIEDADPYCITHALQLARRLDNGERMAALDRRRAKAKALRARGATFAEIGRDLGVSTAMAGVYAAGHKSKSGTAAEQKIRAAAAKQQKRELARLAAVERRGGNVAEAYSLIRKALQELDRAIATETKRDAKYAMQAAITRLHSAEDEIIKAVKLS